MQYYQILPKPTLKVVVVHMQNTVIRIMLHTASYYFSDSELIWEQLNKKLKICGHNKVFLLGSTAYRSLLRFVSISHIVVEKWPVLFYNIASVY